MGGGADALARGPHPAWRVTQRLTQRCWESGLEGELGAPFASTQTVKLEQYRDD